ncbi:hypothetical protein [Xanthocytophaga agilis]|uniref:Uncharacterized protein n=1 Tax=Xanthocytophaga agilis TaxID=3048010 RepID=A0AAE3RBN9_9BACT|nr:hypothetical protein [Xanthocytophaga agilis]MDJ1505224.1 hypothetical protein [Xanthocytophaga agilis]
MQDHHPIQDHPIARAVPQTQNKKAENSIVETAPNHFLNEYAQSLVLALACYYDLLDEKLRKDLFIRGMLCSPLEDLIDSLCLHEPCALLLTQIKLEKVDIDEIPTSKILDTIRLRAITLLP